MSGASYVLARRLDESLSLHQRRCGGVRRSLKKRRARSRPRSDQIILEIKALPANAGRLRYLHCRKNLGKLVNERLAATSDDDACIRIVGYRAGKTGIEAEAGQRLHVIDRPLPISGAAHVIGRVP